jgi:hypothetical protein
MDEAALITFLRNSAADYQWLYENQKEITNEYRKLVNDYKERVDDLLKKISNLQVQIATIHLSQENQKNRM